MLNNTKGVTLTELVVVMVVMSILAAVAMPVYRISVKRTKEAELRADLREMRDAIDAYKKLHDDGRISTVNAEFNLGASNATGYPPTLSELTKLQTLVPVATVAISTTGSSVPQLPAKIRLHAENPGGPDDRKS